MLQWAWTPPTRRQCTLNNGRPILSLVLPTRWVCVSFDSFHYVFMTSHSLSPLAFMPLSLPSIFCFCATTATLSVPKLTPLIIIFLPFWTKIDNFYLPMPGGNLQLDVVSTWNWTLSPCPPKNGILHSFPFQLLRLTFCGRVWASPSPERLANSPSKDAHVWSSLPYLLPWLSPHHRVLNTNSSSTPTLQPTVDNTPQYA